MAHSCLLRGRNKTHCTHVSPRGLGFDYIYFSPGRAWPSPTTSGPRHHGPKPLLQLVCRCHRGKRERSPAMTIGASGGSPLGGVRRGAATADAAGRAEELGRAEAEELGRAEAEEELGRAAHCARPPNTARPMSPNCSSGATLGRTAAATPPEDSAARSRQPSGVRTYRPCASNAALRRANL